MLLALLTLPPAAAAPYALDDAGITLDLPSEWEMSAWSDWDFSGRSRDGVALQVWYTAWQVPISADAAKEIAPFYQTKLEAQSARGVTVADTALQTVGGREVARADLRFTFGAGGPVGVAYTGAFPLEGKLMHVMTFSAAPNAARAQRSLTTILERLTVQKPPADLAPLAGTLKTDLGFTVALPDGWRAVLPAEQGELGLQTSGIVPKDPAKCASAARPALDGTADLVLFCQEDWVLGIVDERSFTDDASLLTHRVFGKAADKVPPAERIEAKDRLGFLLKPEINDHDLRFGAIPYDRGVAVAWGVGPPGHGAELDSAIRASLKGLAYSGPDNGRAPHDFGANLVHILTYNPFHPGVLCCAGAGLMMMAGMGALVFRKPKRPDEHRSGST